VTATNAAPSLVTDALSTQPQILIANLCGENNSTATITVPAGYTSLHVESDGADFLSCAAAYKVITATGTQTVTFGIAASHATGLSVDTFKMK